MKFKNVMLATFLLLAILSIGAISAADDANATLTVNDVAELSQDLDDEAVSIDDADGVNAADDGDILKASVINNAVDSSNTTIKGTLILTDLSTGKVFKENITVGPIKSNYTHANNTYVSNNITETINQLLNLAQIQAGNMVVTIKSQNVSDPDASRYDNRTYTWFDDGGSERYCVVDGEYGTLWQYNVTVIAEYESGITSISNAAVVLSKNAFTFNGNVQKPVINTIGGKALIEGTDYTIQWSNPSSKNAATYTVTIIGKGAYTGTTKATYTINKAANPLKIKGKTVKVKFQKLSKKTQKLKVSKVIKFTKKGQGTLTYAKKSGNKKITINKKTGKITIKKGLKKGTYKVKVKVKAKGNANYLASAYKTVTFKIKIK